MQRLQTTERMADGQDSGGGSGPAVGVVEAAERLVRGLAAGATSGLAVEVVPVGLLGWLRAQVGDGAAYYWRGRDGGLAVAGLGARVGGWGFGDDFPGDDSQGDDSPEDADALAQSSDSERIELLAADGNRTERAADGLRLEPLRLVVGGFDLGADAHPLGAWTAAVELRAVDGRQFLIARPGSEALLRGLVATEDEEAVTPWFTVVDDDGAEQIRYERSVAQGLAAIASGTVQKLVLARRREHVLVGTADGRTHRLGFDVLARVAEAQPDTYHFGLRTLGADGVPEFWIGASPERLFAREGSTMWTEALAGTRPRGEDAAQEAALLEELTNDAKERHEHDAVRAHLEGCLARLCREWEPAREPAVQRLAYVQHLKTVYRGELATEPSDRRAVETLHPTPAICGTPTAAAQGLIREIEGCARGLYGGLIGVVSRGRTDLAVALRSGRLVGRRLTLFAGAGIVDGSEPAREWAETEAKLRAFDSVLDGSGA